MLDQILADRRLVLDQFAIVDDKNADRFRLAQIGYRFRNRPGRFAAAVPRDDRMVERDRRRRSMAARKPPAKPL